MQRKSWIMLLISLALGVSLVIAFILSRPSSKTLTKESADGMIQEMQKAVAEKNVGALMAYIASGPDVTIANMHPDTLALLISRAFRVSGKLEADCSNLTFENDGDTAISRFDLIVRHKESQMTAEDYRGHITVHWKRVDVQHFGGIYHTMEWRIIAAESDGKDPSTFGDT